MVSLTITIMVVKVPNPFVISVATQLHPMACFAIEKCSMDRRRINTLLMLPANKWDCNSRTEPVSGLMSTPTPEPMAQVM